MRPRRKSNSGAVFLTLLFVGACLFSLYTRRSNQMDDPFPRAQWKDATPLGGKGLRLLLERLGYRVPLTDTRLAAMPRDAGVWLILDPRTGFSKREGQQLLDWVHDGGTLIWATLNFYRSTSPLGGSNVIGSEGIALLKRTFKLQETSSYMPSPDQPLPSLVPLDPSAVSDYWTGVQQATASGRGITLKGPYMEVAGNPVETEMARLDFGKGHVLMVPDALLFTNYALSKPDNAILVTNLIGVHVPPGKGAVYFDEREHGEDEVPPDSKIQPSLLYYLWRPPLRYAMLQLLAASLLLWAFYGRRLGTPVLLPDNDPVTRAGQFAVAMGTLFQKAGRPKAAGVILGEEFRRALARRLGMSTAQSDAEIAQRAGTVAGMPPEMILRLLSHARTPAEHEADVLNDAQEMEYVLRRLKSH